MKGEKYFFNAHIFDQDSLDDHLDDTPPPVFSEEDLEAAKSKAFNEGKNLGIEETRQSIEAQANIILSKIAKDISAITQEYQEQKDSADQSVIALTLNIFRKLFPVYNQKYGFKELTHALDEIIKKQTGQAEITIDSSESTTPLLEKHLECIPQTSKTPKLTIQKNPNLSDGAFKLSWESGGAYKDLEGQAGKIQDLIDEALALHDTKSHDSGNAQEIVNPSIENSKETIMETPDE